MRLKSDGTRRTTFRRGFLLALSALVISGLAACFPTSAPVPMASGGETSSASSTPSPTPTPPSPVVKSITLTQTGLQFADAGGAIVYSFPYASDGNAVASTVTTVLGETPTTETLAGGLEGFPGIRYTWSGFQLTTEDRPPDKAMERVYYVKVTAPAHNGVAFLTPAGIQVGAPRSSVVQSAGDLWGPSSFSGKTCVAEWVDSVQLTLWVCTDDASALVSDFTAPLWLME